uniref:zincin-like metallopeptidase domain-containing protein n=1 Tax=Bordetella pertussis TaxID=520 RepID=UPI00295291D2|nr:zincin-like metallopeptidase domain-containing protein [Bordetella pertussis]
MPITKAEAQGVTRAFVRDYPGALELAYKFREDAAELYGPRAAEVPADMKGGYVPKETLHAGRAYRGRVDVPLQNVESAGDLLMTLRHEVLGHYGANTFAPAEKRALLDGLAAARNEPTLKPLWDDVNRRYAGQSLDVRAEEVFALHCEGIEPSQHQVADKVQQRGQQSFTETCIARVRPMQADDLHNIVCMVAQGLRDRSRTQQNFPQFNELFRRDENMEPKKPFHEVVAEKLIEQLKAGTAPWQKPWEPGQPNAYLPFNPTTGKRYKGINAIHLMAQGRSDGRWMTYKQAAAVGAQVRRGEKGTPVQYWKFSEEQDKLDDNGRPVLDAKGQPVKETVMLERPRVFFATVFNAEQIDGLPPLTPPKEQTWNAVERAEHILNASGAKITHAPGDRAFYRPSTDSITLPERGQFPSADRYYATALHELAHWTGHPSRLDRDMAHPFGSEGYAKEELRAEIASMILGDELGIGHDPGQHAAYVGSWIKVLQDEPLEVFRAAADAEKIHDYVLAFEQKQVQEQTQQQTQQPEAFFDSIGMLRKWDTADMMPEDWQGIAKTNEGAFVYVGREGEERTFTVLKATTLDQAQEEATTVKALAVDIGEVLNNPDVSFRHYEAFQGDSLEQALRDRALTTVGSVTGHDPERFYEVAHDRLSAVFGIDPDYSEMSNAYLERKGLAQEFVEKAEQLYQKRTAVADIEVNMTSPKDLAAELLAAHPADVVQGIEQAATARRQLAAGEIDAQAFTAATHQSLGVELPADWSGELRIVGVAEQGGQTIDAAQAGIEPQAFQVFARKADAQFGEDAYSFVAGTRTEAQAQELAERLHLVDALGTDDPHERAAKLARLHEERVRNDPNATDEDISAAKEARKVAEATAFLNDTEARRRDAELERQERERQQAQQQPHELTLAQFAGQATAQELTNHGRKWEVRHGDYSAFSDAATAEEAIADVHRGAVNNALYLNTPESRSASLPGSSFPPAAVLAEYPDLVEKFPDAVPAPELGQQQAQATQKGERQYISVPFKEKDEAKQLGARWDRQRQSWYVPPGVETAPFIKWAQGGATAAVEPRSTQEATQSQATAQKPEQKRQYLAVPYEQRQAAKAAGALWDKAAKSWYVGPRGDMAKLQRWLPDNVPTQQGPAMTPREEFGEAMRNAGLVVQGEHPIMDGKRHRVPVEGGKKGALDGFYVGHLDGHPAGRIINNKTGVDITWKSKGYALSDQEKAKLQAEAAEKLARRAAEQARAQEATSQRVSRQMADLVPVEQPTPYLQAKGIEAHAGVFTDREGQKTYIPAFDADGKQWTMQYIQEDGTKRFAKDSKKEGCFHPVGGMDALAAAPALVISEGYATAASLAEGLGHATVAAFDSGNLPHVARALREKFPDKPIVIAGDDDKAQEIERGHNPGRAKAEEAAKAVGGKAIFPIFAPGEQQANPKGFTDFNDLANKSELGRDGLKRQVGAAVGQVLIEEGRRQQQEQRQERAGQQQDRPLNVADKETKAQKLAEQFREKAARDRERSRSFSR